MKTKTLLFTAIAILTFIASAQAQNVNIPDANFKAALVSNGSINTNGDAEIQTSEAAAFTGGINVSYLGINGGLTDLTGIEAFVALTYLDCSGNSLSSLNVSTCTALTYLSCEDSFWSSLTSLDVSGCTALTNLDCSYNALTSLDVSACTALTNLDCSNNALTSLDGATNTAIIELYCSTNQLTSLDVSNCIALNYLTCYGNQLTSLNVSANTALIVMCCDNNQLTSLDVSSCTALTGLNCSLNSALTSLDVSANTALTSFFCNDNQLTSLDVSACTALTNLYCYNNQLTSLNVKNGNNINMDLMSNNYGFLASNNPNLSCIEVDNVAWSNTNWANDIDATAYFSENCSGAGISDINESNPPMFYPNPTTGTIYLSDPANISLSDLSGKLLLQEKNTNQLDLSALPAGMYFLSFGENNNQLVKVIKE